ncbi:MAG: hypothetical protein M1824_001328 [Vezdaea acicularis]|nr:MAG: hypothetical protein M1824_001328 [Vezdaea acicularis]
MASIFTYDPNPPRVSSPWLAPSVSTQQTSNEEAKTISPFLTPEDQKDILESSYPKLLADCGIDKLEAEPQDGPTEYKLHLLLRPRKSFVSSTTAKRVSGSHHSTLGHVNSPEDIAIPLVGTPDDGSSNFPMPSNSSRQNRLQHLTTQLLWRLQQSSPYHSSSSGTLIVPKLSETPSVLSQPNRPGHLLPGLEESKGALYEIGVSDDGTFVGLTREEMEESLNNLRSMASSLGCRVHLLRAVIVGRCEWLEETQDDNNAPIQSLRSESLWVAEALVKPDRGSYKTGEISTLGNVRLIDEQNNQPLQNKENRPFVESVQSTTEQLRVSLTGATTSGKSSLLGTLSTATLDNGRGKSRLSLLRHRHELLTGVTSSVAQELIGYKGASEEHSSRKDVVINYASGNISSWTDIHASADYGRLVFFSDSAGHPRYRRTTVRGLVGWAPHWTFLCIAANEGEISVGKLGSASSAQEILGTSGVDVDLSQAHLDFCLKLVVPLVVVITKLDLASKTGLRQTLAKVLSTLKAAGRRPVLCASNSVVEAPGDNSDLSVSDQDRTHVLQTLRGIKADNLCSTVPIVLTSAVKGIGIGLMHALLRLLPIPSPPTRPISELHFEDAPEPLFHVEEVFALSNSTEYLSNAGINKPTDMWPVLSGHLRYGEVAVGDELFLGPFHVESESDLDESRGMEWRPVRVVSIRNLRLPVRKLLAGQVGTIGLVQTIHDATIPIPKPRKGMILIGAKHGSGERLPKPYKGITGSFTKEDAEALSKAVRVVLYVASVRVLATVKGVDILKDGETEEETQRPLEQSPAISQIGLFTFDANDEKNGLKTAFSKSTPSSHPVALIRFEFLSSTEWVERGAKLLAMPDVGKGALDGSSGLGGFVGTVKEGWAC